MIFALSALIYAYQLPPGGRGVSLIPSLPHGYVAVDFILNSLDNIGEGNEGGRLKYVKCSILLQRYNLYTLTLPLPKVFDRSKVLNKC